MKKLLLLFCAVFISVFLFSSCGVQKLTRVNTTYYDIKKPSEKLLVNYKLPVIKTTGKTTAMQKKGGITISVDIVPFTANRHIKTDKIVTYADPYKPGYDNYEISRIPYYEISPENIQFKIRIRNDEQVPLKLSEVGFAIIIDGTQWSFPSGYLDDWNKGLILTGFEKEYTITGPQLEGLSSAQVVYLLLNGVPVSYNDAGSITKKSNFEWYFECKSEQVQKDELKEYSYDVEPIHKEKCVKCSGTGVDPTDYKCSYCDGKGYTKNKDGKTFKCSVCGGSGIRHYQCNECAGAGVIALPKSTEAPIKNQVTWVGWHVNITTNPPGAKVSVVDTKTGEYHSIGMSNTETDWYSSSLESYPIIIEYQGKSIKVLPYDSEGKEVSKVSVDFLSGKAQVLEGKAILN